MASGGGVPEADDVPATRGGDPSPRPEGGGERPAIVALQDRRVGRERDVPDFGHAVLARGEEPRARAVELESGDGAVMASEEAGLAAGLGVPETDGGIPGAGGEAAAVGREREAVDPAGVAAEDSERCPGGDIPEGRRAIVADGGEHPAVGPEGHVGDGHLVDAFEVAKLLARLDVPEAGGPEGVAGRDRMAVGREGDRAGPTRPQPGVRADFAAPAVVPQLHLGPRPGHVGPTPAPARSQRLSGLNARPKIHPSWPRSTAVSSPVVGFHRRIVLSIPPLAIVAPSGLQATAHTSFS